MFCHWKYDNNSNNNDNNDNTNNDSFLKLLFYSENKENLH